MKKIAPLLLSVALCAVPLAGCTQQEPVNSSEEATAESAAETPALTEEQEEAFRAYTYDAMRRARGIAANSEPESEAEAKASYDEAVEAYENFKKLEMPQGMESVRDIMDGVISMKVRANELVYESSASSSEEEKAELLAQATDALEESNNYMSQLVPQLKALGVGAEK